MKVHLFPRCGQFLSIFFHRVLRNMKKNNAQNRFFLSNKMFSILAFLCCNIFALCAQCKRFFCKGWWHHYFLHLMSIFLIVGLPRFQYLVQKCNLKNEFLLKLIRFVLVGYVGETTFLGLLTRQWNVPLMDHLWDCVVEMFLITLCENY
jgi:hypothetical protein